MRFGLYSDWELITVGLGSAVACWSLVTVELESVLDVDLLVDELVSVVSFVLLIFVSWLEVVSVDSAFLLF